jgi:hypothetical protein
VISGNKDVICKTQSTEFEYCKIQGREHPENTTEKSSLSLPNHKTEHQHTLPLYSGLLTANAITEASTPLAIENLPSKSWGKIGRISLRSVNITKVT